MHKWCRLTGSEVCVSRKELQWRHNERGGVSNHQPHDCLPNRYFGADQRKQQSFASLAFVRGIHRWSVNSPHKGPVTWKMFPFDDVTMAKLNLRGPCELIQGNVWYASELNDIGRRYMHCTRMKYTVQWTPLRPKQNGCQLQTAFLNVFSSIKNVRISIKISLNFAPEGPIDNAG